MKNRGVFEALTDTTPQADSAFQHQLEEELIAKMQTALHDNPNGHHGLYPMPPTTRAALRLPFTLAAAMLLVILVGSMLFSRGKESSSNLGLMLEGSPTPTPITPIEFAQGVTSAPIDPVFLTATAFIVQATQTVQPVLVISDTEICRALVFNKNGVRLRAGPSINSELVAELTTGTELIVVGWTQQQNSTLVWLQARIVEADGRTIEGWIRSDLVAEITACPPYPISNLATFDHITAPDGSTLVPVIIAKVDILQGWKITADMLGIAYWPIEDLPEKVYNSQNELVGMYAADRIPQYQPVVTNMVTPNTSGYVLPEGKVLVTVPMDRLTSIAYAVQPGDVVDVMAAAIFVKDEDDTYNIIKPVFPPLVTPVDLGPAAESTPPITLLTLNPENGQPIPVTWRMVEKALVVAVNSDSIALGVSNQQATTIVWAVELGLPLTFVLVE